MVLRTKGSPADTDTVPYRALPFVRKKRGRVRVSRLPGLLGSGTTDGARRHVAVSRGTDGLFTCPSLRQRSHHGVTCPSGLSLCVAAFRRVCPFEDERRCDPSATPNLPPGPATKAGGPVRWTTLGHPRPACNLGRKGILVRDCPVRRRRADVERTPYRVLIHGPADVVRWDRRPAGPRVGPAGRRSHRERTASTGLGISTPLTRPPLPYRQASAKGG
jgi:hypothetical protein